MSKNEKIEELEEKLQESTDRCDELNDIINDLTLRNSQLEEFAYEKEDFAKRCFDGGYAARDKDDNQMKAWLNFKIGERI